MVHDLVAMHINMHNIVDPPHKIHTILLGDRSALFCIRYNCQAKLAALVYIIIISNKRRQSERQPCGECYRSHFRAQFTHQSGCSRPARGNGPALGPRGDAIGVVSMDAGRTNAACGA